jgi:pyruvate formate lyase activating enzyme
MQDSLRKSASLSIGGFVPFTTVDFPGRLAALVFCQGCPWRCGYCHNKHLLPFQRGNLKWENIRTFLAERRNLLEAVVFSGGEPLAQPALAQAMREARELGFALGLHTTGMSTARLRRVLPLVDWVGLDIKAPRARYAEVTGAPAGAAVYRSLAALIASGVPYEVRTTADPRLLGAADLQTIQEELTEAGVSRWVQQPCRSPGLPLV